MNESFDTLFQLFELYGVRLFAAIIAGGLIGLEGEIYHKPAGLRTNILITVGSTLLATVSVAASNLYGGEATRIAAQIVSGVGFIGGGVIIHYRFQVMGITTAATIWTTAAIGMTMGFGFIYSGLGIAFVIFLILILVRPIDAWIDRSKFVEKIRKNDMLRLARKQDMKDEREKFMGGNVHKHE
jgi:putative Mg2+ transporter-C (MgtC) family protein